MSIGAVIHSFRPGEVRLDDFVDRVRTVDQVDVLMLDSSGHEQHITVAFGQKWGGRGWRREMQCQGCVATARVLRVVEGVALCGQCWPVATRHHSHKNSALWRSEGKLADAILRSSTKTAPTRAARRKRERLATRLMQTSFANAIVVIEAAQRIIRSVDNLPRKT